MYAQYTIYAQNMSNNITEYQPFKIYGHHIKFVKQTDISFKVPVFTIGWEM